MTEEASKFSISTRLQKQRRLVVVSLLLVFIAVLFIGVYFLQKVRRSQAAQSISFSGDKPDRTVTLTCSGGVPCAYTIAASDNQYNGDNLIIDGATVNLFGYHHYKNLTIKNSGTVTTLPLSPGGDYDQTTWSLTASGQEKIVNIEVDEVTRFETGGRIDVSEKGYRGGDPHWGDGSYDDCNSPGSRNCGTGDGPGGGTNVDRHDTWPAWGAGGGYGGAGGNGIGNWGAAGGAAYGDLSSNSSTLWFGSGGGSSRLHNYSYDKQYVRSAWGGRGGGSVKVVTGSIESDGNESNGIFAKGGAQPPPWICGGPDCGGAGSGGSIYLRINNYSEINGVCATANGGVRLGIYSGYHNGRPGAVIFKGATPGCSPPSLYIYADGGDAGNANEYGYAASGGGGRILIESIPHFTMKKWLEPIERPSEEIVTNFNPYALKVGDTIKVNILAVNLVTGSKIEDMIFSVAGLSSATRCLPTSVTEPYGSVSADRVTWIYPGGNSSKTLSYLCRVQQ